MDVVRNKTQLTGKWYSDNLKEIEKKIDWITKKNKKQNKKVEEKDYNKYNHHLQKTKKTTKLQKKQSERNRRRALIGKQNGSNIDLKQLKYFQRRENVVEKIDFSRIFKLATTNKIYVNGLTSHQIRSDIFLD